MNTKPKPKINALYRCQLNCQVGKEICAGKSNPPEGVDERTYATYLLFCALEELAKGIEEAKK